MSSSVFLAFFFIVVALPVLAWGGSDIFKRWAKLKERQLELAAKTAGEQAAQYAAKIERLEQRVEVLERIATDRGVELADQIERLRTAPLN